MRKVFLLHITILMISYPVFSQIPDSVAVDSVAADSLHKELPADSLDNRVDTTKKPREEPDFIVIPWEDSLSESGKIVTNDSLLRWQIWPNWGDYQAYRDEVISFRQGTSGRIDAYHINGYGPYEQNITMEGINVNNPITGLPNYNLIPHRKIGKAIENYGGTYHSDIRLRDYYLLKPISYLNYDEAGGNFRNLEFLVSQNFTEKTNLEVSFWDRRDGGYYPNSEVEGSQLVGRVYHHLKKDWLLRGMYLRNQLKNDEPFGYVVQDPLAFIFNEFSSPPVSSNGASEFTRWDLVGGIYHRKDTSSAEDAGFEIGISNNEKDLRFTGDTLAWKIRSLYSNVYKQITWNKLNLKGEVQSTLHNLKTGDIITKKHWITTGTNITAGYEVLKWLHSYADIGVNYRSDNKTGFDITGGLKTSIGNRIKLHGSTSIFSRIPNMQSFYWNSDHYTGNSELENEQGLSFTGLLDFKPNSFFTFTASGRYKNSTKAIFITPDSTFTNSSTFDMFAGTLSGAYENHLFEIQSSATFQQFNYTDTDPGLAQLNHQDIIIWLRNNAFVKGYVFDRAAYLKIGVKTVLSPFYYNARSYNTELEFWQGNSVHQELPPFFRLDGELSARVRRIMVLIRWENALDGLGQAGYFEAAGYPMPPRRLMVGIRAQFRN